MASWLQDPLPEDFGRYRIIKVLGQGGMGVVYLARDTQLDREVALKVPHLDGERGRTLRDRFEQEARAAARIHHPNICPIYDVGEIDGKPYLTMAFIDGKPLSNWLRQGKLSSRQAAGVLRKLALALHEAHQCGVVHRDLKPANVMINRRGEPIIMDFGLARRYRSEDTRLTRIGSTIGTPTYMAPEQCRGERQSIGPASDIYSLGVILYALLAGRPPFTGDDAMAVLSKVLLDEPPPPSAGRADAEPELDRICLKAMAKKVEHRYASSAAMAADLSAFLKSSSPTGSPTTMMVPILLDAEPPTPVETGIQATQHGDTHVTTVIDAPPEKKRPAPAETRHRPSPRSARRASGLALWWWLGGAVAACMALGMLLVLAIVIYRVTDYGTCKLELSEPNAAVTVRVDGADVPAAGDLRLATGAHQLEVSGKDYEPVTLPFTVRRGENPPVHVALMPKPATVTIVLSEPMAVVEIKIDGVGGHRHGQTVRLAPRQQHWVEVTGEGWEVVRQPFTLEPGAVLTMSVHMQRQGATADPRTKK